MLNIKSEFPLGEIVATAGVADLMEKDMLFKGFCIDRLIRHATKDWGDLNDTDKELNNQALVTGDRIMSSYILNEWKIWIITEADRSRTTILFPCEY